VLVVARGFAVTESVIERAKNFPIQEPIVVVLRSAC
jgi:hypothetical protein